MTMAIENQQRHLGSMNFDHMPYPGPPQFTNPWASTTSATTSHLFPTSLGSASMNFDIKPQSARPTTMSMPYSSIPASLSSISSGNNYSTIPYNQSELLNSSQDLLNPPRAYDQTYSTAPSVTSSYTPTSTPYAPMSAYGQSMAQQQHHHHEHTRRLSQSSVSSNVIHPSIETPHGTQNNLVDTGYRSAAPVSQSQATFGDALDAGRGMVAMSQDMTTPRNIYGPRVDRSSIDSYGFPSTHSSHSSISSASTYPYMSESVGSSVTDYSSNSESMEPINSRTLPRPSGLLGPNLPPAPQSMMGQFNSKVSSSTQKKHKCKVCDKRFTRPSSLQTHIYSHTGEK
ncbi:hypothetical protein MMC06_002399, partial [Schaereria dolodes]|nr:hypothetical protein [Schaereria dolodes]